MVDDVGQQGANDMNEWRPLVLITAATFVCFALLISVWPQDAAGTPPTSAWFSWINLEIRLMLIVLISGASGAAIHTARAFAYFHGTGKFDPNWRAWYWLRIPIGMGLALIFYFVARAGLFSGAFANNQDAAKTVNPFGFAALAGLTGMFAKQAAAKLEELFDNLFQLADTPNASAPVLKPFKASVKVGATGADLVVAASGNGFTSSSKIMIDGKERASSAVSASELSFTLEPSDVTAARSLKVTVRNGQQESKPASLEVVV